MTKPPAIGDKYTVLQSHLKEIEQLKKNYVIGKIIGTGKYGLVCEGTMGTGKDKVEIAIKIIDLAKTSNNYRTRFFPNERKSLEELNHTYIVKVHNTKLCQNTFYVFMEKAFGGDLLNMLEEFKDGISEPRTKPLYKMIASALKYMHDKGKSHRDIKTENILLMNKERTIAKLTDFGFSTDCLVQKTEKKLLRNTFCGTEGYSPPELEAHQPYDATKGDVWSLGVVLYIMLQNEMPFSKSDILKMLNNPKEVKIEFKNKNLSKDCKELITKQLEVDPNKRLTMAQVVEHQWLR